MRSDFEGALGAGRGFVAAGGYQRERSGGGVLCGGEEAEGAEQLGRLANEESAQIHCFFLFSNAFGDVCVYMLCGVEGLSQWGAVFPQLADERFDIMILDEGRVESISVECG